MTCAAPPLSLYTSHESMVPNASSPASARRRRSASFSSSQCSDMLE